MAHFLLLVLAIAGAAIRAEAADVRLAVVELFTSSACSACPAADAVLAELAARNDVLALSYHVDYWDRPGAADPLARADSTRRQRAYASLFRARTVYTPQIVTNGAEATVGSRRAEALDAVARALADPMPVSVALEGGADGLRIDLRGLAGGIADPRIVMIGYRDVSGLVVVRGTDAARYRLHEAVVTTVETLGPFDGDAAGLSADWPEGADGVAVLVHAADGRIVGAARYDGGPAPLTVAASSPVSVAPARP